MTRTGLHDAVKDATGTDGQIRSRAAHLRYPHLNLKLLLGNGGLIRAEIRSRGARTPRERAAVSRQMLLLLARRFVRSIRSKNGPSPLDSENEQRSKRKIERDRCGESFPRFSRREISFSELRYAPRGTCLECPEG